MNHKHHRSLNGLRYPSAAGFSVARLNQTGFTLLAGMMLSANLVVAIGCSKPVQNAPSTTAGANASAPPVAPTTAAATPPPTVFVPGSVPTPPALAPAGSAPAPAFGNGSPPASPASGIAFPPGVAVPAQAGVGVKGRSLDNEKGVLVTPAKTLFAARERVVFEIQIPQAMQLFKATNGQPPASHDEFMQRVIAENSIQLPMLPVGQRYQYDPATEQLMVIR